MPLTIATDSKLQQQLQFVMEIDKLKLILRQTLLTDRSRRENSAEHSWHLAVMAIALSEYATAPVDLLRVMQMLLLHDLVEIDAGDTFCYDTQGYADKAEREQQAADRLFGLLPTEQSTRFRALWDEFEAGETTDALFSKALDCLQPFLHNYQTEGGTWRQHGIHAGQVRKRMQSVKVGAPSLWPTVEHLMEQAIAAGYIQPEPS